MLPLDHYSIIIIILDVSRPPETVLPEKYRSYTCASASRCPQLHLHTAINSPQTAKIQPARVPPGVPRHCANQATHLFVK